MKSCYNKNVETRLANAGNDLLTTDEKIIDISTKYGYDSPDSFTKAFTRFHGSTPTAVRKNGQTIKSYAPLKLNFLLKGGYIMDYRIEKKEAFSVVVKIDPINKSITYIDDGNLSEFTAFSLGAYLSEELPECSVYSVKKNEYENTDGFEKHQIPAFTWAVFKCAGASRDEAREKTWLQIKNEWFPQTNYELVSTSYIIINYATEDVTGNLGEIWTAIKINNIYYEYNFHRKRRKCQLSFRRYRNCSIETLQKMTELIDSKELKKLCLFGICCVVIQVRIFGRYHRQDLNRPVFYA